MSPDRIIALRVNGIGRHGGCSCCNVPGRRIHGYSSRVRANVRRFVARDLATDASDGSDLDICDGNCPACGGVWGFDVEPVSANDDGERWSFGAAM